MSDTKPLAQESYSPLEDIVTGYIKTQMLYVAAKLGIAEHLSEGPKSSEALAKAVGAHPQALYRLLRALENLGLFSEPEPGIFVLTPLGTDLKKDSPSRVCTQVIFNVELFWRIWGELAYSVTTGRPATEHVYGVPFFDHLKQHTEQASIFNEDMTRFITTMAPAVVAAYDFGRFNIIVDIGGGHGTLMATILQANHHTRGVIFDLPVTVEGAQKRMSELGLGNRCRCVGGDFFAEVPVGDAIILSAIISDWDDEKSVRILTNCRRSIAPDGRLLLLERLLIPDEPAPPTAILDLAMFVMGGGTGRTEREYRSLLAKSGFELLRVVQTGTQRSIFEAEPM